MAVRVDLPLAEEYVPRRVSSLDSVGSRTWDELSAHLQATGAEVLPIRGGPSRPLPSHVRDAVVQAMDHKPRTSARGMPELRVTIAELLSRECATSVNPDTDVLVTNGAMHALSVVFRALLEPGDRVLIPAPSFFFEGMIRLAGAEPVYVPCYQEEDWRWDVSRIAEAVDSRTKMFIACNPSNPTGYLPTQQDMGAIVELSQVHKFIVLSDESYDRLVYDKASFTPMGGLGAPWENLITVRSMSKSYAMPSWRIGYIAASAPVVEACLKVFEWDCLHVNYVAQAASVAALRGPQGWLDGIVSEFESNRMLAYTAVQQAEALSCVFPQAGPFLFLNVSGLGQNCERLAEDLLREAGVPTVPGRYFQQPGYLRLPFGGDSRVVQAMAEALRSWAGSKSRRGSI